MTKFARNRKGFKKNVPSDIDTPSLDEQIEWLQQQLSDRFDVVYHLFVSGSMQRCALVYLQGMVDLKMLQDEVLRPLFALTSSDSHEFRERIFERKQLPVSNYRVTTIRESITSLFESYVLLLVDGDERIIVLPFGSYEQRAIDEPANKSSLFLTKTHVPEKMAGAFLLGKLYDQATSINRVQPNVLRFQPFGRPLQDWWLPSDRPFLFHCSYQSAPLA